MFDELREDRKLSNSPPLLRHVQKACLAAAGLLVGMPFALLLAIGSQGARTSGEGLLVLASACAVALLSLAAIVYALIRW
jgi:hypothetical protein